MSDLVHVKGLAEIDQALQELAPKIERNVLRGGLRAGVNEIRDAAEQNINSVSGDLAKSLKVRTGGRGGEVRASLYTRHFTAQWVEYGTKPHTITAKNRKGLAIGGLFFQSVNHPGASPHPFMRPALDTRAQAAVVAAGIYMRDRLATKHGLDTAHIAVEGDE